MNDIAGLWTWIGFTIFLILALLLDSYYINKKSSRHAMSTVIMWTVIWISSAFVFNILLWFYTYYSLNLKMANEVALAFFTGYLIEKSLSVDNLFAFYIIFKQFHIPAAYQARVFSYGIFSAVLLRLILIWCGVILIEKFHWIFYFMGAFLLLTGLKMIFSRDKEKDLHQTLTFKTIGVFFRLSHESSPYFFIKKNGYWTLTPLFIALVFIEMSDLMFALDSIPAIFAITTDPFIVWTSNIFAILGLRALYFLLAESIERFHLLKYGIAIILTFIGIKMLIAPWIHISALMSLLVIVLILISFISMSMFNERSKT